jgi:hypothetical protein
MICFVFRSMILSSIFLFKGWAVTPEDEDGHLFHSSAGRAGPVMTAQKNGSSGHELKGSYAPYTYDHYPGGEACLKKRPKDSNLKS